MIHYAFLSEKGSRPVNEDSVGVYICGDTYGFIVCDGLGGHSSGGTASAMTVERFGRFMQAQSGPKIEGLRSFFDLAHKKAREKQKELYMSNGIKTTADILLLDTHDACIAHIGDSRTYIFQNEAVTYKTSDDSVPGALALAGLIAEDKIRGNPDRNKLLKAIGMQRDTISPAIYGPVSLTEPTAFLLCSDGFWEHITEKEMIDCIRKSDSPEQWLSRMKAITMERGRTKQDNYSAITIWCLP